MKRKLTESTKLLTILIPALFVMSCASQKGLYSWHDYSTRYYSYIKNADERSFEELTNTYQEIIDNQTGSREVVPPGIYADYAYLLLENGKTEEAKAMFEKEIELYPESAVFIKNILARIEK